jgi:lysophospholipase L1-like esterase
MQFRTEIPAQNPPFGITHQSVVTTIGSCFAENIGENLLYHGFDALLNPFGIVYNPQSIAQQLSLLLDDAFAFSESDIFEHNGLFHTFQHHSRFDKTDKRAFLMGINEALRAGRTHFARTDTLLLTLGTAQIHAVTTEKGVFAAANCHKMPATNFHTRYLSVSEIVADLGDVLTKIKTEKPHLRIVFTVSPVRYLREGLLQNTRSKATLHLAVAELCAQIKDAHYFPAYEYLLDDLRDYRFFADDMLHPNATAIAYIWEKMQANYCDETTQKLSAQVAKARKMQAHRPFNADTAQHRQFLAQAETAWKALSAELPHLQRVV